VVAGASSRLVGAVSPRVLRRAILVGAAGALVVAPAHAEQAGAPDTGVRHSVSGLPFPDRPDAAPAAREVPPSVQRPAAASAAPGPAGSDSSVEVRPGDTLWAIARRSLPAGASATQVAAATRAWHDANRAVIGDDPDLIFPAQRLVPPTAKDLP
jgi:nucleoid-associated protein YgaU